MAEKSTQTCRFEINRRVHGKKQKYVFFCSFFLIFRTAFGNWNFWSDSIRTDAAVDQKIDFGSCFAFFFFHFALMAIVSNKILESNCKIHTQTAVCNSYKSIAGAKCDGRFCGSWHTISLQYFSAKITSIAWHTFNLAQFERMQNYYRGTRFDFSFF